MTRWPPGRPCCRSASARDWSWVGKAHDAGIATATQVYDGTGPAGRSTPASTSWSRAGPKGGGHGDVRLGTLPLLDTVLDVVSVPVLAGGGIASARSLAAVLAAGASGAWVGTRLAACPEALTGDGSRRALIAARATDTTITRVFDVAARPALAGAVPVAGAGQRLRRALDGQGGRARSGSAGPGAGPSITAETAGSPPSTPARASG